MGTGSAPHKYGRRRRDLQRAGAPTLVRGTLRRGGACASVQGVAHLATSGMHPLPALVDGAGLPRNAVRTSAQRAGGVLRQGGPGVDSHYVWVRRCPPLTLAVPREHGCYDTSEGDNNSSMHPPHATAPNKSRLLLNLNAPCSSLGETITFIDQPAPQAEFIHPTRCANPAPPNVNVDLDAKHIRHSVSSTPRAKQH